MLKIKKIVLVGLAVGFCLVVFSGTTRAGECEDQASGKCAEWGTLANKAYGSGCKKGYDYDRSSDALGGDEALCYNQGYSRGYEQRKRDARAGSHSNSWVNEAYRDGYDKGHNACGGVLSHPTTDNMDVRSIGYNDGIIQRNRELRSGEHAQSDVYQKGYNSACQKTPCCSGASTDELDCFRVGWADGERDRCAGKCP